MYLTKVTVRAEGAKNTRKRPGHQGRQLMHIASYNVQTLSPEAKLLEMEEELDNINWDIVGVSEVKRRGEDQITLRSGYKFHFKGEEDSPYGGVGSYVHKKHIPNLEKIECVSPRVYLVLRLNPRYSLKVIQNNAETALGNFGYGERNERGEILLDFLHQEDLFAINCFFTKKPQRQWTWMSANERTKNEIDFIITNRRDITILQNDPSEDMLQNLLDERRKPKQKYDKNFDLFKHLNKEIQKEIRKDIRQHNTREIPTTIEEKKSLKVLRQHMSTGRKTIHRLKNSQGRIVCDPEGILNVIEGFYRQLYDEHGQRVANHTLPQVMNLGSEHALKIPGITSNKVRKALHEMKNNKSPGEDGVVVEAMKLAGTKFLQALVKIFNKCIIEAITRTQSHTAVMILLHKKGETTGLKNYRPISLLSNIYKLFTKVLTKRLENKLEFCQAREQA
ncbi:hypothetical protein HUJ05_000237 [Dendroctonus ponderosae]|nr:hypothetical protein HUJ05_000237 [Dendroctonus ponderosae]